MGGGCLAESRCLHISPARFTDGETETRGGGGGTGTITNARAPSAGSVARRKPLGAALRNPAIVSAAGEGAALGASLAGGRRQTRLKGTTWVSDQIARLKKGNTKREGSYRRLPQAGSVSPAVVHELR